MPLSIVFLTYGAFALFYLYSLTRKRPLGGAWLLAGFKALPVLILAYVAGRELAGAITYGYVLAALFLSAGGDVALEVDGERYFVVGLGLFLLAHLAYIGAFMTSLMPTIGAILPIGFVLIFAFTLTRQLYPQLGGLKVPVSLYIGAIGLMGIMSALHHPLNGWLITGSLVFMLSDATIAVNKFLQPVKGRDLLVMSSYYLAQGLLLYGFLLEPIAG